MLRPMVWGLSHMQIGSVVLERLDSLKSTCLFMSIEEVTEIIIKHVNMHQLFNVSTPVC